VRILIVKVSSMGDVIHALPVVRDLKRFRPDIEIDWVVEEAFAGIVRAHPDVTHVIPFGLRRWKKNLFSAQHWREWKAFRQGLKQRPYDAVFDLQGLFKTALLCRMANGPSYGFNRAAAREPLSATLLDHPLPIRLSDHMIEQLRSVPAQALGYRVDGLPDFAIDAHAVQSSWLPAAKPYVVLLHMTAAQYKLWNEAAWSELSRQLLKQGLTPVLPWGTPAEKERAERIVHTAGGGIVAPRLGIMEWGRIMCGAHAVAGLDTGLSHLAAALGARTVFLFGATPRWRIAPYWGRQHITLGEPGQWPGVPQVLEALTGPM
jgi:heptosyltransferase-1